ncbi:MAG: flagellar motor switch protein FliN [Caldithrix sp.]|nr:MAG: flagellar motor switch protein FliN [Caldithrix sp.]
MADEPEEEVTESSETEQPTDDEAIESALPEQEESDPDVTEKAEEWQKSPEEAAAEEAMLAELEAASSDAGEEAVQEPEQDVTSSDPSQGTGNLDLLRDVTLTITVELGRRDMRFGEVLELGKGSLVELNKVADEPVDIYVNQSKIAEGEVVVVDDHFGVRITKLLHTERLGRKG